MFMFLYSRQILRFSPLKSSVTFKPPTEFFFICAMLRSKKTWRHLEAKVGTSKGGGKQWQPTPKKLPWMQCARAIPVAWLGSGSCQNRPSGWILMMMSVPLRDSILRIFENFLLRRKVCNGVNIRRWRDTWNENQLNIVRVKKSR